MNTLQYYCDALQTIAIELGYVVKITGTKPAVFRELDARTLKIYSNVVNELILLQLEESKDRVRIYRHRTSELTSKYRYKTVSLIWVTNFMKANVETTKISMIPSIVAKKSEVESFRALRNVESYLAPLTPQNLSTPSKSYPTGSGRIFNMCRRCGGDGGAGGRCPHCGGNGFEPN